MITESEGDATLAPAAKVMRPRTIVARVEAPAAVNLTVPRTSLPVQISGLKSAPRALLAEAAMTGLR